MRPPFPTCRAYDPAFGYEVAVIVEDGVRGDDGGTTKQLLLHHAGNENYPSRPCRY